MNSPPGRFEFRAFAANFGDLETYLQKLVDADQGRNSEEIYLISQAQDQHNLKIRSGQLDVKSLIKWERGLEQWWPSFKIEFPVHARLIELKLAPKLGVSFGNRLREQYSESEFLKELIEPEPLLQAVCVEKRRFGFSLEGCQGEIAYLGIEHYPVKTVSVESERVAAVLRARAQLGLEDYPNINYPSAIKQIIGTGQI